MKKSNPFLTGTLILTAAGFASRLIGFFYRAFLSQTFGEEGMGIYQLLAPVMALSFSLTAAGVQTAVSKFSASETTTHDYRASLHILAAGFLLSMPLSILCTWFLYQYSDFIALRFLFEERSAPLIRVFALSIPFCSIHSLFNGYFYGIKRAKIPAITQIGEQLARVGSVFLICGHLQAHGQTLPLTASRIAVNLLQSIEAVSIPGCLLLYGLTNTQALSVYGVLTGMALPLILFPAALVNSACVLLLPVISEADESGNHTAIRRAVKRAVRSCLLFGLLCTICFLLFGRFAGSFLFNSHLAGSFILTLSFICPLLYLSGALSSILHGLGKTGVTFLFNIVTLSTRLFFVFCLIPKLGIQGYLYGLLVSQFLSMLLTLLAVRHYIFIKA